MKPGIGSVLLFIICSPAMAQSVTPPALVTNGCGSGRLGLFVPDKIAHCTFIEACTTHDICYAKCLEGGALEGKSTCNVKEDKARRREVCDKNFQSDIIAANPNKRFCGVAAAFYRFAVQKFGENYFKGIGGNPEFQLPINDFLEYFYDNPEVFDPIEVEQKILQIVNAGLNDGEYKAKFEYVPPRMKIIHKGALIVDIVGKVQK